MYDPCSKLSMVAGDGMVKEINDLFGVAVFYVTNQKGPPRHIQSYRQLGS